jgi:hypothetical protein
MALTSRGQAYYKLTGPRWRVQTLLLQHIIHYKQTVSHPLIQEKFSFHLKVIFYSISFLHTVRSFKDSTTRREQYPYLALCSLEALGSDSPLGRARGWFSEAPQLLQSMTISLEHLHSFNFSLDAPHHLLPTRQVLN